MGLPVFWVIRHLEESPGFRFLILGFLLIWNLFLLTKVTLATQSGKKLSDPDRNMPHSKLYTGLRITEVVAIVALVWGSYTGESSRTRHLCDTQAALGQDRLPMGHHKGSDKISILKTWGPIGLIILAAVVGLMHEGYASFVADLFLIMLVVVTMRTNHANA